MSVITLIHPTDELNRLLHMHKLNGLTADMISECRLYFQCNFTFTYNIREILYSSTYKLSIKIKKYVKLPYEIWQPSWRRDNFYVFQFEVLDLNSLMHDIFSNAKKFHILQTQLKQKAWKPNISIVQPVSFCRYSRFYSVL